MRTLGLALLTPSILVGAMGCGSDDPANIEGMYNVAVTNRDNACNLPNWTSGETASGIGVNIVQVDDNLSANVTGLTGLVLIGALGSSTFTGDVDGTRFDLIIIGTAARDTGTCNHTYNANIIGRIDGDLIEGRLEYTIAPTSTGDIGCEELEGCLSFQEFNGTRPPT